MAAKLGARVLAGLVAFSLWLPAQAGERIDWLKKLQPAVVMPSGKGKLLKVGIADFKAAGEMQTPAGPALAYEAALQESKTGISVRAAELSDFPALVVWLKFEQAVPKAEMGSAYLVNAGLEMDQPREFPRVLSFGMTSFAPPHDKIVPSAGPVLFFNDRFESVMVSPLDHFLVAMMEAEGQRFRAGLEGDLKSIPAGFEQPLVFYFSKGIRQSFDDWGVLLRKWYKKERPGAYDDVGIAYLGYWTDNGSYYYYKTEKGMTYEQTLLQVKDEADRLKVPFGYFQLDSWWYPKTTDKKTGIGPVDWLSHFLFGGAIKWEARPELFPNGIEAFSQKLGLPLIAHARWFDQKNAYRSDYKFVDGEGMRRPAFPVEDRFFEMLMSNARQWGIRVYEQDWLDAQWRMIPYLRESVEAGEKWLDAMSRAAARQGMTIQYCMANPGMFMQAVKYPNITQVRTSDDYMAGMPKQIHWIPFTKTSMLAWAVGLYPWKDTFLSSTGERVVRNERRPEEETLISILSAGMVGPGDRLGFINQPLLMRTCRKDGLLLKPDRPAMPIDRMFIEHKTLYTIITEVKTGVGTYYYVAGFNIYPAKFRERELLFSELGVAGERLVYSWNDKKFQTRKDRIEYPAKLDIYRSAYFVLVPENRDAPSLLGEPDKFVTVSNARFKSLESAGGRLRMTLSGVAGEELTLVFRAASRPVARVISGARLVDSSYEESSRLFSVKLELTSASAALEAGF